MGWVPLLVLISQMEKLRHRAVKLLSQGHRAKTAGLGVDQADCLWIQSSSLRRHPASSLVRVSRDPHLRPPGRRQQVPSLASEPLHLFLPLTRTGLSPLRLKMGFLQDFHNLSVSEQTWATKRVDEKLDCPFRDPQGRHSLVGQHQCNQQTPAPIDSFLEPLHMSLGILPNLRSELRGTKGLEYRGKARLF